MTNSTQPVIEASAAKTARWVLITGVGQVLRFLISVTSAIILGRLLVPGDFGLIATIAPLAGLLELLRDMGFSQAIIQRADITPAQGHALFWITMMVTAALALVLAAASPLISAFFHDRRLLGLVLAEAASTPLATISNQSWAWLNRQLRFLEISLIDSTTAMTGLVVSCGLAAWTHSYWSIFFGGVASSLTGVFLTSWRSGWRPGRPTFDRHVLEMARFGAGISTSNIFTFLARNADNLLIARADGPISLGLYDRAYKLMLLPLTQVNFPLSRVLTPVLARLREKPAEYVKTYLTTVSYIMLVLQPGLIAAVILAKPLIALLLGPRWSGSAPIFAWLACVGVIQVASSTFNWLYISQGRGRQFAIVGAFTSVTTIASFIIGLHWGPVGVAAEYVLSEYVVRTPFTWWYVGREGPVTTPMIVANAGPHALGCLCAVAAVLTLSHAWPVASPLVLLALVLVSYGAYGSALTAFSSKRALFVTAADALQARMRTLRVAHA